MSSWKDVCRVGTTTNITLSGLQTIDGVSVASGNRVLVKNQTSPQSNGIYIAAAGAWSRSTDANTAVLVAGMVVPLGPEGTQQPDTAWACTTTAAITLGATPLRYAQVAVALPKWACR